MQRIAASFYNYGPELISRHSKCEIRIIRATGPCGRVCKKKRSIAISPMMESHSSPVLLSLHPRHSRTSLTFAMGTRDNVAPEFAPKAAVPETAGVDEGGAVDLDGVAVGVDDEDDGIGAGLAALASCNACKEFSILAMMALWSV